MSDKTRTSTPTVPEILGEMARTFDERNKTYGDSYKLFGEVMSKFFPNGVSIGANPDTAVDDFNRAGILFMVIGKLTRMAAGGLGHVDSIHDIAVYSTMYEELLLALKAKQEGADVKGYQSPGTATFTVGSVK